MMDAVIIDAVRTPIGKGKPGGALAGVHPVDLHAHAIRSLIERIGIDPAAVDDVISGAVGQVGEQSMNTARWAALAAGLPESVPAVTVDRQCGSSQQAIHFAAQVLAGIFGGISQPDIAQLFSKLEASGTYQQFSSLVEQAQGSAGLMRFWQLDLDMVGR